MRMNGAAGACESENCKSDSSEVEQKHMAVEIQTQKTSEYSVARKEKCQTLLINPLVEFSLQVLYWEFLHLYS